MGIPQAMLERRAYKSQASPVCMQKRHTARDVLLTVTLVEDEPDCLLRPVTVCPSAELDQHREKGISTLSKGTLTTISRMRGFWMNAGASHCEGCLPNGDAG